MSADLMPTQGRSPFDTIRRWTEDGAEYWSARDLMPMLGYESWQKFEFAIDRAVVAGRGAGADTSHHFNGAVKVIEGGRWGTQTVADIHLTRYACYLIAMNGDPRKREIAEAQTYFAVKTREAEITAEGTHTVATLADPLDEIEAANSRASQAVAIARQERARAELAESRTAELEPKAAAHDTYLSAANSSRLVRQVAQLLSWRERDLREFLIAQKILFVRETECGQRQFNVYAEYAQHFRPVETVVTHNTIGLCSHYTVYVRPSGIELIRTRIAKQAERELAVTL